MHFQCCKSFTGFLGAAALLVTGMAHANFVANGDFETGDFSAWTQFGNTAFSGVDGSAPQAGNFAAYFGNTSQGGILQQLATTAGVTYHVSFWLQNEVDVQGVAAPNTFEFNWDGGAAELSLTDSGPFGYRLYDFDLMATTASTALRFTFTHSPAFWDLDSVQAVPEPGALALVSLAGLLGIVASRRRRA